MQNLQRRGLPYQGTSRHQTKDYLLKPRGCKIQNCRPGNVGHFLYPHIVLLGETKLSPGESLNLANYHIYHTDELNSSGMAYYGTAALLR